MQVQGCTYVDASPGPGPLVISPSSQPAGYLLWARNRGGGHIKVRKRMRLIGKLWLGTLSFSLFGHFIGSFLLSFG